MLDDLNIITTAPCLPTNAVFKTNIPFCFLFFQNCNHIKAYATNKAVLMSTREHALLEEVSRYSLYLG